MEHNTVFRLLILLFLFAFSIRSAVAQEDAGKIGSSKLREIEILIDQLGNSSSSSEEPLPEISRELMRARVAEKYRFQDYDHLRVRRTPFEHEVYLPKRDDVVWIGPIPISIFHLIAWFMIISRGLDKRRKENDFLDSQRRSYGKGLGNLF